MKLLSVFAILIAFGLKSYSQDTIYLKNKDTIIAKVISIEKTEIWYKKYENLHGPEYKLYPRSVREIIYKNGCIEQLNTIKKIDFDSTLNNMMSLNIGDFLYAGRIGFSFTHYIFKQKASFKIPLSVAVTDISYQAQIFNTGVDLNYLPWGVRHVTNHFGVGTRIGQYDDVSSFIYNNDTHSYSSFWGMYANYGLSMVLSKHFTISTQIGMGFKYDSGSTMAKYGTIGELNLGIRF